MCKWHHPYDRKWRGTKEPLDESERGEESEKAGLKFNIQKTNIMASSPTNRRGKNGNTTDFIFLGSKITVESHEIKRCFLLGRKAVTNLNCVIRSRDITADKGLNSESYGFFSSLIWIWELDHKAGWVLKNWCFWTVVLEKTLESSSDGKVIEPVHPKGNQTRIFIGKTDAVAEAPILWPPDNKELTHEKRLCGKGWEQGEKAMMGEMVGWHHRLNGHEFEPTLRNSEGQGRLVCRSPRGCKESETTEQLNNRIVGRINMCGMKE